MVEGLKLGTYWDYCTDLGWEQWTCAFNSGKLPISKRAYVSEQV